MLELNVIHKSFGNCRALNGVNFHLERGFVYKLIGGNGLGKIIISGFLAPTKGVYHFKGRKISKFAPSPINRLGIGRTFKDLRLATQLSVYKGIIKHKNVIS